MIEDVESKVVGDQDVMNYSAQGPFWATTIKYLITNTNIPNYKYIYSKFIFNCTNTRYN